MLSFKSNSHLTLERLFAGVSFDVSLERAFVDEGLATVAKRTLVHLSNVPQVRLLVPSKASHVREVLVTHLTPDSNKQG